MKVLKITPILLVERIEPVLDLWERRLGFQRLVGVPETGELALGLLARGETQVMLQTTSSLDLTARVSPRPTSVLYIDVESLDEAQRDLAGVEVLVPPHATFYGTRELSVRDSQGQVLSFAEQLAPGAP